MIKEIAEKLKKSNNVLVITGAGISAPSNIPTYRGQNGIYNGKTKEGLSIEDILKHHTFENYPELSWKYLFQLGLASYNAKPNLAHLALADMSNFLNKENKKFKVYTQNVDGLHQAAGQTDVHELHGNFKNLRCCSCGIEKPANSFLEEVKNKELRVASCTCGKMLNPNIIKQIHSDSVSDGLNEQQSNSKEHKKSNPVIEFSSKMMELLESEKVCCSKSYLDKEQSSANFRVPRCECGGILKPSVVLYGEQLNEKLMREFDLYVRNFDALIVVGTTLTFPYIKWPAIRAKREAILSVEINLSKNENSHLFSYSIQKNAAEVLPEIYSKF